MLTQCVDPHRVQARQAELFLTVRALFAAWVGSLHTDRMVFLHILSKEDCFILIEWQVSLC